MVRHFLSQNDVSAGDVREIFQRASRLKSNRFSPELVGRTLVMFFEKSSTRTRLSFEAGMTQLGGHAIYVDWKTSHLASGESLEDTARVVSRYADLIVARVNYHSTVSALAGSATVPVINGLSDVEHPCQSLTDLFTIEEKKGDIAGLRVAYIGDGNNNVTHSLMLGIAQLGGHMRIAAPTFLQPDPEHVSRAREYAAISGGTVTIVKEPLAAVDGADVIYTDIWVSMGREADRARRFELLRGYAVTSELTSRAAQDFIFMHCLPAHIGEEVTAEVAYGPHSVIFEQAENRLHVQKALMLFLSEQCQGAV